MSSSRTEPLSPGDLQRMMEALPEGLTGERDRALILQRALTGHAVAVIVKRVAAKAG